MRLITKLWATLLLLCVAGVANAATEYEVDQKFTSVAALEGQLFAIVNETDGKAIYNKDAQNLAYDTYANAIAGTAYLWKIHSLSAEADANVQNAYAIEVVKADGSSIGLWGNPAIYLNSGAEGGFDGCFVLGNKDQYGTDVKYGGAWEIEYDADKGFALKNVARQGYFAGVNPAPTGTEPIYWTLCTLKEKASTDPLAEQKDALEAAIAKGKMYNAIAFTEATFGSLTSAVADGEAALTAADATAESLTGAATAINNAVLALALKDGITVLTAGDFMAWDSATEPTTGSATGCSYELFMPSGLPYGDGNVGWKNFALLKDYDKLYVTFTEGTPRVMMNRDTDGGGWNEVEAESHLIEFPKDGWSAKYFTNADGVVTVDLKQIVADKGFANLNAIKGANWQNVTVTGLYLYKEAATPEPVEAPATPTFTPAAGEYFASQTVTIACETEGAAIYYTLDGTAPTAESALYAEPIAIAQTTTVKAIAIKDGVASEVAEAAYTITEPLFADGTYYIYNKGAQKFLAAGSNWGTHAVVNETGLDYIVAFANGKYTLDSQVSNGGNSHFLNGEWNDGAAMGWIFAAVEGKEGVYTISNGTQFLTAGEDGRVTLAADATVETAQWTLTTLEARIAELATATSEAPVNATFLIQDANFGRNDLRKSAWKMEAANQNLSGGEDGNGSVGNNCAESYHSTFALSQVIANAPAGKYKMTAQGFYRQDGSDNDNLPVFYANDKTGTFPLKTGSEGSMTDASKSFTAGNYTIEPIEFTVFEDGQLTIGAKLENNTNLWCIWDNFQLTYVTKDIPADEFEPAYTAALAAAKAAKDNESYAAVTGAEKTALEKAISDYETIAEPTADTYRAAISALTNATTAFTAAKADYEALNTTIAQYANLAYPYASAAKKAAAEESTAVTATSAADATAKAEAVVIAYRQYAESNALLEGNKGAKNCTDSIKNPNALEAIAAPWAVVLGEGSGGSLNILDGEPLTDGTGSSAYKYFDGGNWGANAWDVALEQKIALPAGKYLLTAAGRASADVDLKLFAGKDSVKMAAIGAQGALFGRGWNDASVEFELAEADSIVIGVRGVTSVVHNWMSFTRFRLMKFWDSAEQYIPTDVEEPVYAYPASWDFTKWSDATIANLKADAARSKINGWSDVEKKTDAEANADPTEISKDNCFWHQGATDAYGQLYADGELVQELKGLKFDEKYADARSLAIAVNYPSTSLGEYAGGQYLWLGGGGKSVPCFVLPAVPAGMTITMAVESHKPTDARGVELYAGSIDAANKIGESFKPTALDTYTWTIEETADIVVYNTSGCHIYSIKVSVPDDPELVAPEGWTNMIANGNLAGEGVESFFSKEANGATVNSTIVEGAGKNGSRGIVVKSADNPSQAWDTQFWIKLNEALPTGAKLHVEFDYAASKAAKASTQAHGAPGAYQHWAAIGDVNFTTEWKHFSTDITVDDAMAKGDNGNGSGTGLLSIAFNLAEEKTATEYYFDNFGVWAQLPEPVTEWADIIINGNMEGESMECFYVTEQGFGGPYVAMATEGIGKDGGKAVKVQSADNPANAWDTQFFIRLPYQLPAGTQYKISFDYKATTAAKSSTQIHAEPGSYIGGAFGDVNFTTDWQSFEKEGTVGSDMQTFVFNLAEDKTAQQYIFDNVKVEVPANIVSSLNLNPAVDPKYYEEVLGIETVKTAQKADVIYNLRGQKMMKLQKGLNIVNGRKIVVK